MNQKRIFQLLSGLFMLLVGLAAGGLAVQADSILNAPNVSIPAQGESVSGKYSFIAKFNEKLTKVQTFGEGWKATKGFWGNGVEEQYLSLRPNAGQKGKNGVIYTNVGSYQGKEIDLRITIKDWQQFSKYQGYISYSKENISHFAQGYDFVDQEWAFFEQGTNTPVEISGFMTINDIDGGQGIQFSKETSAAIDKIYVSGTDNWIKYQNINEEYKFYDTTGNNSKNEDLFATFTFLYSNQRAFRFKWCVDKQLVSWDYENLNYEKDFPEDASHQGAYFGYLAKKPLKTETLTPVKKNSDTDEQLVDKNTLMNRDEEQIYTITHQVPNEYEGFYYSSYSFEDTLDSIFEISSMTVLNETKKDCQDFFDLTVSGNKAIYTAKDSTLKNPDFYGHYYTTVIKAKIKKDAVLSFEEGLVVLKNKAKVTIDGVPKETNETKTELRIPQINPPVKRVINEKGEEINGKKVSSGEILIYELTQKVNELNKDISSKYSQFIMADTLPKQVTFQSAAILKDGQKIEAQKIEYDKTSHRVTFAGNTDFLNGMSMKGEQYTLQITVRVIDEVGEGESIENIGNTTVGDQKQETNKVVNPLELPKGSITIMKVAEQPLKAEAKEENSVALDDAAKLSKMKQNEKAVATSENIVWGNKPQEAVVYQVTAYKDIQLPNGKIIAKKGQDFGEITTDVTGKATIENLYPGEYAFIEVKAPAGIQLSDEPIIVLLKADDKGILSAKGNQENRLQEVKVTVNKLFEKEDGLFEELDGAVFGLYHGKDYLFEGSKIAANTLVSKLEIKAGKGSYKGKLLPNQQYYVQEISTIPGYQLKKEAYHFAYMPISNTAVHEIELYENGWIDGKVKRPYLVESETAAQKDLPDATEMAAIKNLKSREHKIVKRIVKTDGSEVEHYDLLTSGEQVIFKGLVHIGDVEQQVSVSDWLPEGFSYENSKVIDQTGKELTSQVSVSAKGQDIRILFKQDYLAALKGTTVSWLITTTYTYNETHKGKIFENQLNLTVDGQNVPSNLVTLTPPATTEKPAGMLPSTGEIIKKYWQAGLLLVISVVSVWYVRRRMRQEEIK